MLHRSGMTGMRETENGGGQAQGGEGKKEKKGFNSAAWYPPG